MTGASRTAASRHALVRPLAVRAGVVGIAVAAALGVVGCSSDSSDTQAAVTAATFATAPVASATAGTDSTTTSATPAASTTAPATDAPTTAASTAPTSEASTAPPTTLPAAVVDVSVQPGTATDEYVGARSDVSNETCGADGADFVSTGTVTNATNATVSYRIYSALVRDDGSTAAVLESDVRTLRRGKTAEFTAVLPDAAGPFQCVLRVERTGG